ncbi:hypothetical protein DQ04_09671020, partial [Trypanosoma grayi]|uniref:hypothetical protein n=1 Tax=Trypanosoma grayi TaxID=71804 RepID=UPI0004F45CD3
PPATEPVRRRLSGGVRPVRDGIGNSHTNKSNALHVNLGESGEGVYLDDLSWEDKEKVIKALLFFINQTCYQRLPGTCASKAAAGEDDDDDDTGDALLLQVGKVKS